MIVIGIVGTPAGGKSTVAAYLQEKGAIWVNADAIARDILDHPDIREQLVSLFGDDMIDAAGHVQRAMIAARVFGRDPESARPWSGWSRSSTRRRESRSRGN